MKKIIVILGFFLFFVTITSTYANADNYLYLHFGGQTTQTTFQITAENMIKSGESSSYGGIITTMCEDKDYIYVGGTITNKVYKYLKIDMSKVLETSTYGGTIRAITAEDDTYIYYGGETTNKIYKAYKNNLTKHSESVSLGYTIWSIAEDTTYIYVGVDKINDRVYQMYKSNLTVKDTTADYDDKILALCEDTNYIYYGGGTNNKIYRADKLTMTKDLETISYGGVIQAVDVDDTYIYYGGYSTQKVYKAYKSNLTKVLESPDYGGAIYSIKVDDNYVYVVGATTNKMYQYYKTTLTLKDESVTYGGNIFALSGYLQNTTIYDNTSNDTFYLRFYDISTGDIIYFKGKNIDMSFMSSRDYLDCYLLPSVVSFEYGSNLYDSNFDGVFPVTIPFEDGENIVFTLSNSTLINEDFKCRIDGYIKYFKYKSISLKVYAGQTYNIYLEPTSYVDGVEYSNCGVDLTGWGAYCCLNKQEYSIGETLRLEYKLPPGPWLNSNNYGVTSYQLKVYNKDDYFLGQRLTGLIKTPVILSYTQNDGEIILDGNRHTLEINVLADINEYGFDEFFNDYEIVIETYDYGIFQGWKIIDHTFFYVNGLTYLPNGTINSITPNPCYMGQEVSIAWQSNGNGYIEICYPNGHVYYRQPYGYSSGVHTLTKTITAIGTLAVNLYTNSLLYNNTLPVDTDTLICTPLGTNGTYGSYGYGVPYLYIPSYRGIAGYDTIYIYYRTYKNDSILNVTSPRQEQTFFSTTVSNQSDNVLAIPLEPYMQIGVWNVTLTGGDISGNIIVLSSSFNIVNEEGNWIEFTKNVYNTNDVFSLFIKHTYRISLTFYKDDIAQGESIIYEIGENDNTIVNIEKSLIALTAGNWRVEMYRINDRNIVELLAEDICMVEYSKAIDEPLNIDFMGVIPAPIKLLIGIIIPVIFALIPLLVIASLSRKGKDVDNLELICVAFFFFGMFISIMLTFLPVASIFIVLLGVIVTFALMYIQRKEG